VNEELHTVNTELSNKVEALDSANSDLQNLFESTEVATIFLDRTLAIRSFTPTVARIFNILPGDRGRPITDLSSRLNLANLADDIDRVFAGESSIERRVKTEDDTTHYLVRLSPYRGGEGKTQGIVIAFIDITNIIRAEVRQSLLIDELQHRTRNLLTVVQSVAHQTIGKGGTVSSFTARLAALGRVQDLLSNGHTDRVELADIVRLELDAIGALNKDNVRVVGQPVALGFDVLQTMALAVHELTTNALKYGALKHQDGSLAISWAVRQESGAERLLIFDWRETGVAIPSPPKKRGFGRELIERALTFSSRAKSQLTFGQAGIFCHIELPIGDGTKNLSRQ
jgi:two-component system CheB/CheR fusion protein